MFNAISMRVFFLLIVINFFVLFSDLFWFRRTPKPGILSYDHRKLKNNFRGDSFKKIVIQSISYDFLTISFCVHRVLCKFVNALSLKTRNR